MHLVFAIGLAMLLIGGCSTARAEGASAEDELSMTWSATLISQYKGIPSPENDDGVGGWFDQYEFTPNKSSSLPVELGIRDGAFDLFRGDGAILQARLEAPSSNLGVSGSQKSDAFFNQRIQTGVRLPGIGVDLSYRRIRTEQLRIFPDTFGPGLVFNDATGAADRFYRDRTGFAAEGRLRPYEAFMQGDDRGSWLAPQLSLRGAYDSRDGKQQIRTHRGPSNDWLGLAQDQDRSVSKVGGGLLVAPGGLLTVAFDFDHEKLRFDSGNITDGDLGYLSPPGDTRTIGFVPDTNRSTGTLRFNSAIGDRAVIEGGVQISELEQVGERTPDQRTAGLNDNRVRYYAANAAFDAHLKRDLWLNGFFKLDRRENDIDRDTSLYNSINQVDPFVKSWQRILAGAELEMRFRGVNRFGLGLRYENVERKLEFSVPGDRRVLPANAHINRDTRIVTLYTRAAVRPLRRLKVDAELGYRWAPHTGYAMDLDNNFYGELRASYVVALTRPIVISTYVRGGQGDNKRFTLVSGRGPVPAGAVLPGTYERSKVVAGLTASSSLTDRVSVYASFYYGQDNQDTSLDLSDLQRYFQDIAPIGFASDGKNRFENQQTSFVLGLHHQLSPRTDGGISYSYTSAEARYGGSDVSPELDLISEHHVIDSDTHVVDFEVGHWVMDGLRVLAGYRYQHYADGAPLPTSVSSRVVPFDRSTHQHTVTLGITLTSELVTK